MLYFSGMVQRYGKFGLSLAERNFSEHYAIYGNGTKASIHAGFSNKSANAKAATLLRRPDIQNYIQTLRNEAAELAGVTVLRNMLELAKIAYSNAADIHKNWTTLGDFENLPPDVKAAIKRTKTKIEKTQYGTKIHYVEVELHDKLIALKMLNQMCGFDQPVKIDLMQGNTPLPTRKVFEVRIIKPLDHDE